MTKTKAEQFFDEQKSLTDVDLNDLRGGQARLSVIKQRIQRELDELRKEEPLTRLELATSEYQRALSRSSEVGTALAQARRVLNAHTALFDRNMPLTEITDWSFKNFRLNAEYQTLTDLSRLCDEYAERCRVNAEVARQEPDPERLRILQRIATLKDEFGSLNWNDQSRGRGVEILSELRELNLALNNPVTEN